MTNLLAALVLALAAPASAQGGWDTVKRPEVLVQAEPYIEVAVGFRRILRSGLSLLANG